MLYAAFIATIVLTAPFAWFGLHFGRAVASEPEWAYSLLMDTSATLSSAIGRTWQAIREAPFALDPSLPAAQICGLLAACVPWAVFMLWVMHYANSQRKGEESGSSRWADVGAMRKYATKYNPDPDNVLLFSEHVGIALSRAEFDIDLDRNINACIIGGSGSGKTRYYVKPNLMQLNGDFVVTDPKGDTLPEVGHMLIDAGYEVRTFNTFVPELSMRYNPFRYVKTDLDVIEFVTMFFALTSNDQKKGGDQFWDDSAMLLLGALIAYLRDYTESGSSYDFRGLQRLLDVAQASEDNEAFKSPLDQIFEQIETGYREVVTYEGGQPMQGADGKRAVLDPRKRRTARKPTQLKNWRRGLSPYDNVKLDSNGMPRRDDRGMPMRGFDPEEDFALRCYKKFKTAAGKTLKSIIISVNVKFNAISTSQVSQILSGEDEMRLDQLGRPGQKTALFCTFKDTNQATLGFLHGMLVFQAINVISDTAIREYDGRMPRTVNFLLDEFKSLRLPKNITDLISTVRSRNIGMSVILQSASQLDELYDDATGKSVIDCCDTMLFLGGKSEKTTKMISDAVGQQTITTSSTTVQHSGSGGYSTNIQHQARALMDAAEVSRLRRSQCIVLINGEMPIIDNKYPLDQHRRYALVDPGHKAKGWVQSPIFRVRAHDDDGSVKASRWETRPILRKPCKAAAYESRFDVAAYLAKRREEAEATLRAEEERRAKEEEERLERELEEAKRRREERNRLHKKALTRLRLDERPPTSGADGGAEDGRPYGEPYKPSAEELERMRAEAAGTAPPPGAKGDAAAPTDSPPAGVPPDGGAQAAKDAAETDWAALFDVPPKKAS